jgi:hypothetical protein
MILQQLAGEGLVEEELETRRTAIQAYLMVSAPNAKR